MKIEGMGLLGEFGIGRSALEERFRSSLAVQDERFSSGVLSDMPSSPVCTDDVLNYMPARALRHADHFSRMALLAVFHALDEAGLAPANFVESGIVLVSGHGPLAGGFEFLESIRAHGPQLASPLAFSLSVHNIPAAVLALSLRLQIPCTTLCRPEGVVFQGLRTARSWLREGRVERVLFTAVEERSSVFERIARAFAEAQPEAARRMQAPQTFAEAACCLLLRARDAGEGGLCLELPDPDEDFAPDAEEAELFVCGSGAVTATDAPLSQWAHYGRNAYGQLPIAQALDIALACAVLEGRLGNTKTRSVRCVELGMETPQGAVRVYSA